MEISKSISFITEDPRWQQKLMIGTGVIIASTIFSVVIIGLIGFIIFAGYTIRLLQNVRDGQPYPLPEWDQWGEDLARGFKLVVATFTWALPIIVLIIPTAIGSAMTDARNDGAQFIGAMLLLCGNCLVIVYALLLTAVTPGISIAFAKDEQISSGLQFREIIEWTRTNIGQVLVVTLVYLAAVFALNLIGSIVGVLLCLVGLIITLPLATLLTGLFQYHMYGQLAYSYPYPVRGSDPSDPTLTAYTPATDMAPGIAPLVPPTGTDKPVGDTTDYPGSGVDNPAPPPTT
jgi:hypothetical protein